MHCILIHLQRELSCLSQSMSPHSITIINASSKNTKTTCLPLLLVDSKGYTIIDDPQESLENLVNRKKKKKFWSRFETHKYAKFVQLKLVPHVRNLKLVVLSFCILGSIKCLTWTLKPFNDQLINH